MAEQKVNKSALIGEYLDKHAAKKPAEIARLISKERGVNVSAGFVSSVKSDRKKGNGKARPKAKAATSGTATVKAPAKTLATKAATISQHVANLKAAAQSMGKDEAKRIIELL